MVIIADSNIQYKAVINIENIVATVTLDQNLDLYAMERSIPNIEYDPDQFPGLIFRLEQPKVTSLIFKSGKWSSLELKAQTS